jgi:hypothetical protein
VKKRSLQQQFKARLSPLTPAQIRSLKLLPRIAALRTVLTNIRGDYDPNALAEDEIAGLAEAFCDGFGSVGAPGHVGASLPDDIRSGFLQHRNYIRESEDSSFWRTDGSLPPSRYIPLSFFPSRLRLYFKTQVKRFGCWLAHQQPGCRNLSMREVGVIAERMPYQKPWYEVHALRLLDQIQRQKHSRNRGVPWPIEITAGQLGRLVEQYYWRFQFERLAEGGLRSRRGASAGGTAKAKLFESKHIRIQRAADQIWSANSHLSKTSVANIVKRQLRLSLSVKHIASVIEHP